MPETAVERDDRESSGRGERSQIGVGPEVRSDMRLSRDLSPSRFHIGWFRGERHPRIPVESIVKIPRAFSRPDILRP